MSFQRVGADFFSGPNWYFRENDCPVHGPYQEKGLYLARNDRIKWMGCPRCMEEQLEKERRDLAADAVQRQKAAILANRLRQAALPEKLKEKTLLNFNANTPELKQALDTCNRYIGAWERIRNQGNSIIMVGRSGTGKTHLACGIVQEVIRLGDSAVYARAASIVQAVKDSFDDKTTTERKTYESFAEPDLLVIDEVGRGYGTDAEANMLFEVINMRYERAKPMIVISNLERDAFSEYLGEAILSRLQEGGRTLHFSGVNRRQISF